MCEAGVVRGRPGDTITVGAGTISQPSRSGVIEDVLSEAPARFLVRWADGRQTIVAPAAGSATITPAAASGSKRPAKKRPAKKR
jgi:hypothetical protein